MNKKSKVIVIGLLAIATSIAIGSAMIWLAFTIDPQDIRYVEVYAQTDTPENPLGTPIDILEIPAKVLSQSDLRIQYLTSNTKAKAIYIDKEGLHHPVTYEGIPITPLKFSLYSDKVGFFYSPELHTVAGADVILMILDTEDRIMREVYRRDFRTSTWEWDGPTKVIVYYGCGTACLYAFKIDVNTGEELEGYHINIPTPANGENWKDLELGFELN